ncbi:MAG: class I SAM-dependent methyltransferase [Alphaproteobacteria bacterium]
MNAAAEAAAPGRTATGDRWSRMLAALRPRPAERAVLRAAERLRCGTLDLTLPDGRRVLAQGIEPGPAASLTVNDRRALARIVTGGDLGFAEAYVRGEVDTPDLTAFIAFGSANWEAVADEVGGSFAARLAARLGHLIRANSRRGARRNILAHYDLGNEFYAAWLDPTLTYSSALFEDGDADLHAGQVNKYRRAAEAAGLGANAHVLEIGCGWGGFAEWAAREIGCRVTAITVSDAQHAHASRRIQRAGLTDRVEIRRQDYRDVEGRFDGIVSIEMFEAVGERYWPAFFDTVARSLTSGARAAIQVITIDERAFPAYRRGADFIQRYVFPGGMLPSPTVFRTVAAGAGLQPLPERRFGSDYAQTLRLWRTRFEAAWPEIRAVGFDERFRRLWRYYLCYCEAGFDSGRIDVMQIPLVRP